MQSTYDNENNLDIHQDSERGKKRPSYKNEESTNEKMQQIFFHNHRKSETIEDLKLESQPNSGSNQKQQQKITDLKKNKFKKGAQSIESDAGSEVAHNMFASMRENQAMHSAGLVYGGIERFKSKHGHALLGGGSQGLHNQDHMMHPMRKNSIVKLSPSVSTLSASVARTAILQKFKITQQSPNNHNDQLIGDPRTSKDVLQKKSSFPIHNSPEQLSNANELESKIVDTNKKYQHMSQSMGGSNQNIKGLTVKTRMNPLQSASKQSKEEDKSSQQNRIAAQSQPQISNNFGGFQNRMSTNNQILQRANSMKKDMKVPTTKTTQKKVVGGSSSPDSNKSSQSSSSNVNSVTSSELSESSFSSDSSQEREMKKKEDSILNKSSARKKKIDEVNAAKNFIQQSVKMHQANTTGQQKQEIDHASPQENKGNQVVPMTLMTQEGDQYATPNEHGGLLFSSPTPYQITPGLGLGINEQPDSSRRLVKAQQKDVDGQQGVKVKKSKTYKNDKKILRRNDINSEHIKKKAPDEVQPDYQDFFARINANNDYGYRQIHPEVNQKCILVPDDPLKTKWELMTSLVLVFTAVTTPLQLAFSDSDNLTWTIINYIVDSIFFVDIILSFFSAYEGEDEGELEHNHWKIAKRYITSWFFIDIMTILPVSEFLQSGDFTNLARVARLPKLYRLIRMVKLIRIMRIVKERNTISKYLNEYLKVGVAMERLSFFCFIFVILVHIVSCFWVIISSFEDNDENMVMHNKFQDLSDSELYLACFYYTTVIVTTIGYGDITVRTPIEQVFALILLIIGVIGFSFAIGSLSSVLSSLDVKAGKLQEKMDTLNNIREEYKIPYDLYRRLRLALNYDHSKKNDEHANFINELPAQLKVELSVVMHQDIVNQIKFFKHKSPHFIAFLMPLLRPIKVEEKRFIYQEGDPIDEIFFLTTGQVGYVLNKKYDSEVYYEICRGYYFGEIDFIYCDEDNNNDGKRKFSAMAIQDSDLLVLKKIDLLAADQEFEDVISDLFQNAAHRLKRTIKLKRRCKAFYKNLKKQQNQQEMGETDKNGLVMGNSIKEDGSSGKDTKPAMFLSLNKLSLFNSSGNTKKSENYKNAFLNDLKKKMDTNNLDLEALEEVGKDIEDVLSEEISTPKDNDSDMIPSKFLEDEDKHRQFNAEKNIGEQKSNFVMSSHGDNRSRTINNGPGQENKETFTRFLTNQKSMISQNSLIPLENEYKQKSSAKNLKTQGTHSIMKLHTRLNANFALQQRNNQDSDESPNQRSSNKARQQSSRRQKQNFNEENDVEIMFQNSNIDDESDKKFPVKAMNSEPLQKIPFKQNSKQQVSQTKISSHNSKQKQISVENKDLTPVAGKHHKNNFFEEVKVADKKHIDAEDHSLKLHHDSEPNNESGKKTLEIISGSIRWNLMKSAMTKKNGGGSLMPTFKTPQVELNKVQEKRKNIINKRHISSQNTKINIPNQLDHKDQEVIDQNFKEKRNLVSNHAITKQPFYSPTDQSMQQRQNQIENNKTSILANQTRNIQSQSDQSKVSDFLVDSGIRYAQINERISKFETMLGQIYQIMQHLNEPPTSIQNMDHAGQGGIDETVHQEQIKDLLRKAYQEVNNAPVSQSQESMD